MKKILKFFLFIIFFSSILVNINKVNAKENYYNDKIYKIGVIEFDPYVKIDNDGKLSGYYIEFLDLIAKELNLNYEYVLVNIGKGIDNLETGDLDFSLGVTVTKDRTERVIFNVNSIALEKFALYTNKNINSYNLQELNGLKFGAIRGRAVDWILDFFKASNIDVEIVYKDSYDQINELFYNGEIDLVLDSAYKNTKDKKIYEFVSDQVYIAANKNNREVLNDIDNAIISLNKENKVDYIYNSYFDKDYLKREKIEKILNGFIVAILLLCILIILFPIIKKEIYKIYIRSLIKSKIYEIYYQGIYNPKDKEIIGFESILKDKRNNKIIDIKDLSFKIEDNFISEICIWQLKKILLNYKEFKRLNNISQKKIYIAINIPINKIKDDKFIDKFISILNKYKLMENNICIELIGNIKNINSITKNISKLKKAGFIIAIDDFGIEYSNLNIIQDMEIDIIKVDKSFINGLENSLIKYEIISFMSRVGKGKNKIIILNGVKNLEQNEIIKNIDNNNLYVQGDFYDKSRIINDIIKIQNN